MNLYSEIIKSKTNEAIPLFYNNKSMHSKYAPLKEAESFGNDIKIGAFYTIILGLGGGYHIESFINRYPDHKILVIEESIDDINFLKKIDCVENLIKNKSLIISDKQTFKDKLIQSYLPAIFGGINILCHRAWYDNNKESADKIIIEINDLLKVISKDYSVQCHFGLIWQKNIISNLSLLNKIKNQNVPFDTSKTAAIIAAGPSLDSTIFKIKDNRNKYFIFATDTSLSSLNKNGIKPDAVVSIDGQNISYKHFVGYSHSDTIYIFDLQSNFNAVNYVSSFTNNIIFTKSGHPFCNLVEQFCDKSFINMDSGAGTVTIAAIDFANSAGFKNFEVFGADFSYINNKPYTKGTYLDILYRYNENKIQSSENLFTNLLYRTEVLRDKNIIKTDVLESYKRTFIQWIESKHYLYKLDNNIYYVNSQNNKDNIIDFSTPIIKFSEFKDFILNELNIIHSTDVINYENPFIISLLPFVSYLRNINSDLNFSKAVKLALSKILEYT